MPTEQKGGERLEQRLREQLPMFPAGFTDPRAATVPTLYDWQTSKKHLHTNNLSLLLVSVNQFSIQKIQTHVQNMIFVLLDTFYTSCII